MTILLHGALAAAQQFDQLLSLLGQEKPCIALNLPGHGGRDIGPGFTLEAFAQDVIAAIGPTPAHLFGYSMGGYVALYTAWKYPDKVLKVTTLNTKIDWNPEVAARLKGMMDTEKISAKAPEMAAAFEAMHAPTDWKAVATHTASFMEGLGAGAGIPSAAWPEIKCPVTVLRGELDKVVTAAECTQLVAALPHATYAEVPHSGHNWEQVEIARIIPLVSG